MASNITTVQDEPVFTESGGIQPMTSRSLFWQANYLVGSSAVDMLPFLFWITENTRPRLLVSLDPVGEAYFSFCQTIERLSLDARAFNVTAEDPGAKMLQHNTETYDVFSTLLHEPSQSAVSQFAQHSIDLLYVDLARPDEDLSVWRDKLSPRCVVVLCGASDRNLSAALQSCLQQMGIDEISFTLDHSSGMALALGPDAPGALKKLSQIKMGMPGYSETHKIFYSLGKAHHDAFHARSERKARRKLETKIFQLSQDQETATQTVKAQETKIDALRRAFEARDQQIAMLEARHQDETSALQEALEKCREDQKKQTAALRLQEAELTHKQQVLAEATEALESKNDWLRSEVAKHKAAANKAQTALATGTEEVKELRIALKAASELAAKQAETTVDKATIQAEIDRLSDAANQARSIADAEISALNAQIEERTTELVTLTRLFEAEKAQAAKDAKARAEQVQTEINRQADAAEQTRKTADAEISALNDKLEDRTTELTALTQLFEAEKARNARTLADRQEWQDIRIELRDAEIAMLRGAGFRLRRGDAPSRAGLPSQKKQLELIRGSALFDPEWYLKTYPDVAKSQADPASHYMLHGALDGRNPGPGFDTMAYYRANRDVARLGFNALVHYEMFGRNEKRKLRKDG
jgi:hypothetical protein